MNDRTVHAITAWGNRIIHDDVARKWYVENVRGGRRRISVAEAVDMATQRGSAVFLAKPGGRAFDYLVTKRILERAA